MHPKPKFPDNVIAFPRKPNRSFIGPQHLDLAKKFKKPDIGKILIRCLIDLEKIDPLIFMHISIYITSLYDVAQKKNEDSVDPVC